MIARMICQRVANLVWGFFLGAASVFALDPEAFLDLEKMKPRGQRYEAQVPDTLDLADRAALAVNSLTRNVEPEKFYAVYQSYPLWTDPANPAGLTWNITAKNARTLPFMRVMSGSEQNLEVEYNIMKTLLTYVAEDGMMYYPFGGEGAPEGTAYPVVDGIMALATEVWHERDGNDAWLGAMALLTKGLYNMAIRVEEHKYTYPRSELKTVVDEVRAYYPPESGYREDGTWHWTTRGNKPLIPYRPPDEPYLDQQGLEGAVKWEQSHAMRTLVKHYARTGHEKSLELARRLARFCLKPSMWEDTSDEGYPGHEHGIFAGHFHGNITALYSLLELAIADDDQRLKELVREAYDHARRVGVIRMGWFPCWVYPERYNRDAVYIGINEACGAADMVLLAVKLSDAGVGDYWDDVDHIVRNHLSEMQACDIELIRATGDPVHDHVRERFVGGFGDGGVTGLQRNINGCCSANGAMGLYYAWHGITRFDQGVATVNMFLNRASAWMDIDSCLPYEGKVALHNKQAHTAYVRIPAWVPRAALKTTVNGKAVKTAKSSAYLLFSNLKPGDEIQLEFPVDQRTDTYTINKQEYSVSFRGSTVVDIDNRIESDKLYPYYLRDGFKGTKAPTKTITRFAADDVLPLQ